MGKTCIDAAQKSLVIMQQMAADGTLSSLTAFDSTCILRLVMISLLAYAHTRAHQYRSHIETCIALCRGMEQIAFTKMVTEETPMRLADLGIVIDAKPSSNTEIKNESDDGVTGVHLDDQLIAQLWDNFDP